MGSRPFITRRPSIDGTWTPVVTFATPGDLAISAYASQVGRYTRIDNRVWWSVNIQIAAAAATWTTASGALRVTGLPFPAAAGNLNGLTACIIRGYTKVGFTQVSIGPVGAQSYMETLAGGSAQIPAALVASEFVTAQAIAIYAEGHYNV